MVYNIKVCKYSALCTCTYVCSLEISRFLREPKDPTLSCDYDRQCFHKVQYVIEVGVAMACPLAFNLLLF